MARMRVDAVRLPGGRAGIFPCDGSPCRQGRRVGWIAEPLREGRPIPPGSTVRLFTPREDGHLDCETIMEPHETGGPAAVATDAYRDGWDAAFGRPN